MGLPNGQNLQDLFNQRFGANAYQNGVNSAQQAGQNYYNSLMQAKIQAQMQQDFINQQKQQAALQKPINDQKNAADYWNQNKDALLQKGAYRAVQDLQNDPELQAQLKSQGYDVKALADQAYNVATGGKIKSASGFKEFYNSQTPDAATRKANQDDIQTQIDTYDNTKKQSGLTDAQMEDNAWKQMQTNSVNQSLAAAGQNGLNTQQRQTQMTNDLMQQEVNKNGVGNFGNELERGLAQATNGASLGLLGQLFPKFNNGEQMQALMPRTGTGGNIDKATGFLGSAVPFALTDGALSAAKLGGGLAEKGIAGKLGQTALNGAVSGGLVDAGQQGIRYGFNPDQFNAGDSAKELGMNALLGGAGGVALHGAGGLLGQLNLKGQLNKVLDSVGGTPFNPNDFQKAFQDVGPVSSDLKPNFGQLSENAPQARKLVGNTTLPGNQSEAIGNLANQTLNKPDVSNNNWFSPNALQEHPMVNFAQQGTPQGRGILQDTSVPKVQSGPIRSLAEDTLNKANQFTNAPSEGFNQRLLNVQQDMHGANQTNAAVKQEMQNAIQQQYEHLKGTGGKGTDSGVYTNGKAGNFKEQTGGRYSVSNNPKWYQDFYKATGRAPSDKELKQIAEIHVRNGFQDHLGNIPAWKPQDLQHVHDQIDEIHTMIQANPEQSQHLAPVLKSLEQDEARLTAAHNNALSGKAPNINELYAGAKGAKDPKNFDELIKMAQMEHNAANPGLKTMLRTDPKIKQQLDALNLLGKPSKKVSKVEVPTPAAKQAPKDLMKGLYTDKGATPKVEVPTVSKGMPKLGDVMKGLTEQKNYILDSVKTKKNISSMSKSELQKVASQLEKQHELVSKGGSGSAKKLAAIESDMAKVKQAGLKLDLQFFGEHAKANPIEAAREKIFGKSPDKTPQDIAREKAQVHAAVKKLEEKGVNASKSEVESIRNIKDIKPWQSQSLTTQELIDKLPAESRDRLTKIYDEGKAGHVDNYIKRRDDLYNKVVKELGIKKSSKESGLVQDYGEKTLGKKALEEQGKDPEKVSKEELNKINESELNRLAGSKADNIRKADKYIQGEYAKQIEEVNAVKGKIYPNQPDKLVPIREDYYHHFNELHGFDSFKDVIERNHGIDPHLAGISQDTKPKTKWAAPWQKRGNGEYKSDAVGGMLRYLGASSYATHIDPIAAALRSYADHFATASEGVKSEYNIKTALNRRADELTGKTHVWDRAIQESIGRKTWNIVNTVNSHIKKNKILGNLGSVLGVAGNIPAVVGVTKQYAAKALPAAMKDFFGSVFNHGHIEGIAAESKFLKERYMGEGSYKFETNPLKKAENNAALMIEAGDKAAAFLAWHGSYQQALAKKLEGDAAIKFADNQARHLMAGRGIGERPLYQTSKITHMVAPFSLEVGQLWKILGKQAEGKWFGKGGKDYTGLATFVVGSAIYNHVMNQVRGSATGYDPLGSAIEGYNDPKNLTTGDKIHGAAANFLGETLSEIPGMANLQKASGLKSADNKLLFGNKSPDRFGSGTGAITDIRKPIMDALGGDFKNTAYDLLPLLLPFGGSQAAKTAKGVEALTKGGAYNKNGQLEFPISAKNPADLLQALALGPNATQSGQKYFNEHGSALSPKDTQSVQSGLKNYDSIMQQRAQNAIKTQIAKVRNDKTLDPDQKLQKIALLMQKMQQGK